MKLLLTLMLFSYAMSYTLFDKFIMKNVLEIQYFNDAGNCADTSDQISYVEYDICNTGLIYKNNGNNITIIFHVDHECQNYFISVDAPKNECYETGSNSFIYSDTKILKPLQLFKKSSGYMYNIIPLSLFTLFLL